MGSSFQLDHVSFECAPVTFWALLCFLASYDDIPYSSYSFPAWLPLARKMVFSWDFRCLCHSAILVKKNKTLERKKSGISLIFLQYVRPSFYFPVLWLEMGFSQSSPLNEVLCVVLKFSLPSSFKSRKERREKIIRNSHVPNPQFYRHYYYSGFYFSH